MNWTIILLVVNTVLLLGLFGMKGIDIKVKVTHIDDKSNTEYKPSKS